MDRARSISIWDCADTVCTIRISHALSAISLVQHDGEIATIFATIRQIMAPPETTTKKIDFKIEVWFATYGTRKARSWEPGFQPSPLIMTIVSDSYDLTFDIFINRTKNIFTALYNSLCSS